ncbi:MAG: response regulator [Theionarchaea archaeon]|nr:response regulator [Theionarchaea archaeon]
MTRILWIEDEGYSDLIQYKQPMIEAGYVVDVAETASEAFDFLESLDYNVYIVDLILPQEGAFEGQIDFPGVEIIKKMIDHYKINPNTIIVFTVVDDKEVYNSIRSCGVKKIFLKRFQDIEFLKNEVDEILS